MAARPRKKGTLSTVRIVVPLTPEELARYHALSEGRGARSLADLVRALLETDLEEYRADGKRLPPRR